MPRMGRRSREDDSCGVEVDWWRSGCPEWVGEVEKITVPARNRTRGRWNARAGSCCGRLSLSLSGAFRVHLCVVLLCFCVAATKKFRLSALHSSHLCTIVLFPEETARWKRIRNFRSAFSVLLETREPGCGACSCYREWRRRRGSLSLSLSVSSGPGVDSPDLACRSLSRYLLSGAASPSPSSLSPWTRATEITYMTERRRIGFRFPIPRSPCSSTSTLQR